MKKLKVFFILFLFLVMIFFIDSGVSQATNYFIADVSGSIVDLQERHNELNFNVDSLGNYYSILGGNPPNHTIMLYKSIDEGENWVSSELFNLTDSAEGNLSSLSTSIDDSNVIHIAYQTRKSGESAGYNVSYRRYLTDVDILTSKTVVTDKDEEVVYARGCDIIPNDFGEIGIFYLQTTNVYLRIYNDQYGTWGDEILIDTGTTFEYLSSDTLTNGSFICAYNEDAVTDKAWIRGYDDVLDDAFAIWSQVAGSVDADGYLDMVCDNNYIHTLYQHNHDEDLNYSRIDLTDWSYEYEFFEFDDARHPEIAVNSDGTVQLFFIDDNVDSPSNYIFGYYGSYGSWSDLQVYNSVSVDDMKWIRTPYQNQVGFTKAVSGVIGIGFNDTDNTIFLFSEGFELFYNDSGQGNGTSSEGFPQCEASGWIIEKQFDDSIGYYNDTLAFVIKRTTPLFGLYAIMNSTFDVVQTGSFYGATYPTWYFVDPQYGTGTYYFVAGYTWDVWAVNCSFTIVTEGSVSDLWILESTKPTFNVGEDVILRYVIPSGEYGNITVTEDGDPLETLTVSNILGTGVYKTISFGVSQVSDLCYHAYLRNASNNVLMDSTPQFCIGESFFDYDIFVDGEKEVSVTAKDTVSISGYVQGIKSDVYIFMVYDDITRDSWPVGDATNKILFARNWRIDYNYTLGDEVYYLYLGTSYGLFEDKYVTVTVSDYEGEPTPFDDGSWYGLPFWVPYLIGVFLTLFVTMSPLIIGTYITRNSRIEKINIPPLLYVGFFYFGLIISVVMDFLPIWLPFVILFAMIVYFAVTWLAGRQASIQGE